MNWRKTDPSDWPASILFGIAAVCLLPATVFTLMHWNVWAFSWAIGSLSIWFFLGGRTRPGFPFLFDSLALFVLMVSGIIILRVLTVWIREETLRLNAGM